MANSIKMQYFLLKTLCLCRLFFCPFQKNSGPKKLKKTPPLKKLKGHFEQKTQCVGVNLRFQLKNLKKIRHLKPILTDFMVINENFKDFLINLAQNSRIWGEIFNILKKNPQDFEEKLNDLEKNSMLRSL